MELASAILGELPTARVFLEDAALSDVRVSSLNTVPASILGPSPRSQPDTYDRHSLIDQHSVRNTPGYRVLFPRSRILLIQTFFPDALWRPASIQSAELAPAVETLCSILNGRTLVHVFSNGGAYRLCPLAEAYKARIGNVLPIRLCSWIVLQEKSMSYAAHV